MYCKFCGNPIDNEGGNFCPHCGNLKPGKKAPNLAQEDWNRANMLAKSSIAKISNMSGYYCIKCGNYVDRNRAALYGDINCRYCNEPIIGRNMVSNGLNNISRYGLLGGALASTIQSSSGSANKYVIDYYKSEYYRLNKYPFEYVVSDKGRMGEYLINVEVQKLKRAMPGLSFHVFYNLIIPEPNGSFQEIDALIIVGRIIFVIEAKNRSGSFKFNNWSDDRWYQYFEDGTYNEIHSPLKQNMEHLNALNYYLRDVWPVEGSGARPILYNMVTLGSMSDCDWNIPSTTFDELVLDNWGACTFLLLSKQIGDVLNSISQEFKNDYEFMQNQMSDKAAIKIIEALMPQIRMTEDEKRMRMQERSNSHRSSCKYPYQYFYLESSYGYPYLVRTNGVYIQYLNGQQHWEFMKDSHLENGRPVWDNMKCVAFAFLDTVQKVIAAYECVINDVNYEYAQREESYEEEYDDSYNQQNNNSYQNNNQNQNSNGRNRGGNKIVYFADCKTIAELKKAHIQWVKKLHPDQNNGDDTEFKLMQDEYDRLLKKMAS